MRIKYLNVEIKFFVLVIAEDEVSYRSSVELAKYRIVCYIWYKSKKEDLFQEEGSMGKNVNI